MSIFRNRKPNDRAKRIYEKADWSYQTKKLQLAKARAQVHFDLCRLESIRANIYQDQFLYLLELTKKVSHLKYSDFPQNDGALSIGPSTLDAINKTVQASWQTGSSDENAHQSVEIEKRRFPAGTKVYALLSQSSIIVFPMVWDILSKNKLEQAMAYRSRVRKAVVLMEGQINVAVEISEHIRAIITVLQQLERNFAILTAELEELIARSYDYRSYARREKKLVISLTILLLVAVEILELPIVDSMGNVHKDKRNLLNCLDCMNQYLPDQLVEKTG